MENLVLWIQSHAAVAHWIVFGLILLAGCNMPISVDVLFIASALLASQLMPEKTPHLFFALFCGSWASAWITYWLGRCCRDKLLKVPILSKILTESRLEKAELFYKRRGFYALLIGRWIPFGIRNCMFFSVGMSRVPFISFAIKDFFACLIWSSLFFSALYMISDNYQTAWHYLKTFYCFFLFSLLITGIVLLWYKRKRKCNRSNSSSSFGNNENGRS